MVVIITDQFGCDLIDIHDFKFVTRKLLLAQSMPRGRSSNRNNKKNDEPKPDPHEILHNLIQKARNLTDKDIWYLLLIIHCLQNI